MKRYYVVAVATDGLVGPFPCKHMNLCFIIAFFVFATTMLHLLLLIIMHSKVFCNSYSMIVTYGRPTNFSSSIPNSAPTWNDCVVQCYISNTCVVIVLNFERNIFDKSIQLAYSPASPIKCQLFNVNRVFVVEKLQASDDQFVAFKTVKSEGVCPTGDNPPTFGNMPNSVNFMKSLMSCRRSFLPHLVTLRRALLKFCRTFFLSPRSNGKMLLKKTFCRIKL